MNCNSYTSLTPLERVEYIGKLIHAVQSDDMLFREGLHIVALAENGGIFNGVVINPGTEEPTSTASHGLK